MPAHLYIGERGVGTADDPRPINVREAPGINSRRIGQVSSGQTVQVLDGPQCADNILWFKVIYGIGAVQGWIAEGKDGVYFVQPVE